MNGRKAREQRRALRERNARLLAKIRGAVPTLLRTTETGHEVWQRGPATIVLPIVPGDAPSELQTALTVHRMAALTTDCPRCTNDVRVTEAGGYMVRHEAACPGDPDRLVELGERLGVEVQRRED
ncbi:hypothetical protein ABZ281_29365 [Streptomyces sp. NPDC006265]|uniref:hypothetical protein n=1 Tax=Streptomyces sp. NPDC006265 TaxID=3156740 RepID=UPI0033A10FEA